ncbi:MAG: endonuclease, partial [Bacilli bacterium]|nr:endonuclease [Bacilli bacterium]
MKKRIITLLLASGLFAIASCANPLSSSSSANYHSRPQKTEAETSSTISSEASSSSSKNETPSSSSAKPASQSSSSKPSSSSSSVYVPPTPSDDSKWNINLSLSGLDFRNALGDLIQAKKTKSCSYSACLDIGAKAAAYPSGSNKFVPFYHTTDTTTTTGSCNREHTWPNSRGSGTSGPGADPFIIRPTLTSENSSRSNYFYGSEKSNEWDPASCGFEAARGESARVILYAATAWYKNGFSLSNNPGDATSLKTMGTLKFLIQWNKKYAPTDIEKVVIFLNKLSN